MPAIHVALARGTRVLISTATVALQEQLVHKDLPTLAAQMPQPFAFALAKGRGRYVCKLKLERLLSGVGEDDDVVPAGETFRLQQALRDAGLDEQLTCVWQSGVRHRITPEALASTVTFFQQHL